MATADTGRPACYPGIKRRPLKEKRDGQAALSEPDARSLVTRDRAAARWEAVQAAVDSKHYLILAHEVTFACQGRADRC
jgi:hypothetical protein